jgi:hypothetical protein
MSGTAVLGTQVLASVGNEWAILGVSDFDGDGRADIVWRHTPSGAVFLWLMNGTAVVGTATLGVVDPAWTIAGLGG